ncbi:MAG: hypothetical protein DSY41_01715 [Candidatus Poseidoniales archaeon]|nr:MAG: hypothetical protein DSY41_01715 [Candidatus Poseidoniales archaeon]
MSRKEKILKAAQKTAQEARDAAQRHRESERRKRARREFQTPEHRHCVICWAPIPLAADPAVCGSEDCTATFEKREGSRKRLTIMLYLFPAIAILLAVLSSL